jgi:NAD(P)-dependent dehydrogenase (short-subunit alcohol dehydrogenase family)
VFSTILVPTDLSRIFAEHSKVRANYESHMPLGRLGTAQDMANMALALLSDRFAGYVTGTTVAVDGGVALYNWIPLPTE